MTAIITPAMDSLARGETLPDEALRYADYKCLTEGFDPLMAFSDNELNRHHRALALGYIARKEELGMLKFLPNPDTQERTA